MYTARQTAESRTIRITIIVLEKSQGITIMVLERSQGCTQSLSSATEELPECPLQR